MKVLAINGSARGAKGNTHALLDVASTELARHGVECTIVDLADKRLNPCKACYACTGKNMCVQDDDINAIYEAMRGADGIILASPVYFSNVSSRMQMLVERAGIMARTNSNAFKGKVGTSIAVARRAGTNFVYAALNFFFGIAEMPIASSNYWNVGLGREPGDVLKDEEGIKTIKTLAANMAGLLAKVRG